MKKKLRSLAKLAVPYVIIMFLPMISVLCLGFLMLENHREKIILDKQTNINIAFERYLQRIDSVETLSYVIVRNDVMTKYVNASRKGIDYNVVECMEVINLLKGFWVNDDVEEIYFYGTQNEKIITSTSIFSDAKDYFRLLYRPEGFTPQECVDQIRASGWGIRYSPAMWTEVRNRRTKVIEYRTSLPLNAVGDSVQGQLVMVIASENIFSDFYDILDEKCEFYVYDSFDRLIFGSGEKYEDLSDLYGETRLTEMKAGREKVYGMVCRSKDNEWKIKVYLPETEGMGIGRNMVLYALFLVALPIVGSILLCIYFTLKNHKELQELLLVFKGQEEERLQVYDGEEIGYKIIRKYADRLVSENDTFRQRLDSYELSRKQELLDRLVRNAFKKRSEMTKALRETELQIGEGKCVVICIRYIGSQYRLQVSENVTVKDLAREMLCTMLEQQFEIFDTSAKETVCILSAANLEDIENADVILRNIISGLKVELTYKCKIETEIAAGGVVDSIFHAGDSYTQAREVIRYNESSGNEVALYSDYKKLENRYYYPRNLDDKIYNYMVLGNAKEAKEIIERIYKDNFENGKESPSADAVRGMKRRLRDSLISIAKKYDIDVENTVDMLEEETEIVSYFHILYGGIDKVTEEIRNRKEELQNQSASKIISYVNQYYCDNTLSLKKISQELGFSEGYISDLFKKAYGENLSTAVEKLRIKKACELIRSTDRMIHDIAEEVGYTSDRSFRRAFNKVTGVSPGEYREG